MNATEIETIEVDGETIAIRSLAGRNPGLFWLGGYRSDMIGTKAAAIHAWAERNGYACVRHDYSGHGESSGVYTDGTISKWLSESLAVLREVTRGPQILIGSSMGAWIALRLVQVLNENGEGDRIAGIILLAPAPDFTVELMEPGISDAQKKALEEKGRFEVPSEYSDEPNVYTKALMEDGRRNRVLTGLIDTRCPVHILQGQADPDVPYTLALKLVEHLPADDVVLTLVKDGDHRLSRPQDIELMLRAVEQMVEATGNRNILS